jgi:hypothetical protein
MLNYTKDISAKNDNKKKIRYIDIMQIWEKEKHTLAGHLSLISFP